MGEEIRILIDEQGNIKVDAQGYVGEKCVEDTEWLKELGKVTADVPKPEARRGTKERRKVPATD